MLSDQELHRLAKDLESDVVERKESLSASAKEKLGQALCAFANDLPNHRKPGVVFIGLDDEGNPTGEPITDRLLLDLAGFRSDGNILPIPALTVEKRQIDRHDVAVGVVAPSGDPPVRYKGKVWIRTGPRRGVASRDEERILTEKRQSGDLPFDRRPVTNAGLDDLDMEFFERTYLPSAVAPEVLEENRRTRVDQLRALHLLSTDDRPSNAAILLLGKDPRHWLPGAYVQFVRFDGTDLSAPILDQKEIDGRLDTVLRRIDDIARVNVRIATEVTGSVTEQRRPDYPHPALQQLLGNAILHRTYELFAPTIWYWFSDRVEIHSPGGLFGRVTEETFGQRGATDYRNPTLAEGLKILGFVQRFGMGIQLARQTCQDNGNRPPTFEFSPAAVLATVRSRP